MNFLCKQCFPDAKEIGLIGDLCLFLDEDKYKIIGRLSHKDHDFFTFSFKPIPDPDPECLGEDESWDLLCNELEQKFKFSPQTGYCLFVNCRKAGWGEDNYRTCRLEVWLLNYCGKLIQEWENNVI